MASGITRPGANFQLTVLTAIVVAALVAGCGAGKAPVESVAAAPTTNPAAATTNRYRGRGYPITCERGFLSSCMEEMPIRRCACVLLYVEQHVTYQVVVNEYQHSKFLSSAAYRRGVRTCKHA
jgi:hypothetical protein